MDGSAAVIGEMMLPVLEPLSPEALPHARDLGNAFQLTNFLRDIGEDLDRGRQYIPQEDLRRFGVDLTERRCTPAFVELIKFEIERCNELYRSADVGLALLPDVSRRCVGSARVLYSRILDKIVEQDYDVFARRARVPTWQKLLLVGRSIGPGLLPGRRTA
jgi:15-cis-phytoene synthase